MNLEWSDQALADLDRFAEFLHQEHPSLAPVVAADASALRLSPQGRGRIASPDAIRVRGLFR